MGETLFSSTYQPDPRSALDVLAFVLTPVDAFASGAAYTEAGWIVVPFKFTDDAKPSGVACISSL